MADEPEVVHDAEVVPDQAQPPAETGEQFPPPNPGMELEVHPASGNAGVVTLYGTDDPVEIIERTANVANELKKLLTAQHMTTSMGGNREHVNVEGWQSCGTLLGVQPLVVGEERIEPTREFEVTSKRKKWGKVDGKRQVVEETEDTWMAKGYSYKVWAECRTLDGRVVGKGVGLCSREESKWKDADEYAVLGMASTRAISRSLRQALGFIIGMAGYATTPTEEMPPDQADSGPPFGPPLDQKALPKFQDALALLLAHGDGPDEALAATVQAKIVEDCGGYLPRAVARSALLTAVALREATDPAESSDTNTGDTPEEGATDGSSDS
jgi:transposase